MRTHTPLLRHVSVFLVAFAAVASTIPGTASELRRTPVVLAVEGARPSVVNIQGRKTVHDDSSYAKPDRQVNGMGTGVVIDPRGYVITNYHVVQNVGRIQVTLHDRRSVIGRLVTHDPETDLAIIKIPASESLPVIRIGRSDDLMTGESVVAVGNAYGYEHTVTTGIISALHRTVQVSEEPHYYDLIQTDASINPGNSGGPLLNIDGDMIGINVAVRVGAQGIGFAIPVNQVMDIATRLLSVERNEGISHGIRGKTVHTPHGPQTIVETISANTPADKAGLLPSDVVQSVNGVAIDRTIDIERALIGTTAGEEVEVQVARQGTTKTLNLVLGTARSPGLRDADHVWEQLGVRLSPIPPHEFRHQGTDYRGGLRVDAVRDNGPAARQGVREGDVLLGLHVWETISLDNVDFILNRNDLTQLQPMKFYILRGGDTLYGHIRLASRATSGR